MNRVNNELILPYIDQQKCTLCGTCVSECPEGILEISVDKLIFTNPQACTYCGRCEEICPDRAVDCYYEIIWE